MKFLKRKRVLIPAILLAALALSLVPLPVRDVDEETAIRKTLSALLAGKGVFVDWHYVSFCEAHDGVDAAKRTIFYRNNTAVSERIFTDFGLKPLPEELNPNAVDGFFRSSAIVEVANSEPGNQDRTDDLYFTFWYAELGGVAYRLTVVRNFWGVFVFYKVVVLI